MRDKTLQEEIRDVFELLKDLGLEAVKLGVIALTAWWLIVALFPQA